MEDHPLLAVRDSLFNIFEAIPTSEDRLYFRPEAAHAVVTWDSLNPLKPNDNYMSHLLQQSVSRHF
jgi:hypothetical protein